MVLSVLIVWGYAKGGLGQKTISLFHRKNILIVQIYGVNETIDAHARYQT